MTKDELKVAKRSDALKRTNVVMGGTKDGRAFTKNPEYSMSMEEAESLLDGAGYPVVFWLPHNNRE